MKLGLVLSYWLLFLSLSLLSPPNRLTCSWSISLFRQMQGGSISSGQQQQLRRGRTRQLRLSGWKYLSLSLYKKKLSQMCLRHFVSAEETICNKSYKWSRQPCARPDRLWRRRKSESPPAAKWNCFTAVRRCRPSSGQFYTCSKPLSCTQHWLQTLFDTKPSTNWRFLSGSWFDVAPKRNLVN